MDRGREVGLRHYLYGTTPATIERLATALTDRYPGLDIVGMEAPPFRPLGAHEQDELAARIEAAKPDIVWVGVGTPRQDNFVALHAQRFGCTLVPVGAAFDFNSGTKRAAPIIVQRMGMEWLFRFAMEPRRLWRRYLIGIPVFIFGVVSDLGRRKTSRAAAAHIPAQRDAADPVLPATAYRDADPVLPATAFGDTAPVRSGDET
jgi:N-acetylglucosaminyldiphosphoundecaprenol N-acetyl-beta-D-mannosaminyltransferase